MQIAAGGHERSHFDGATLVVTSPGIPPSAEVRRWARERGIPVWGELELGARLVRVPYLAVTGNEREDDDLGMIAACLRAGGMDAVACGNIGRPFPTAALEDHEVLVVEASSFQLADQESFHPRVSVLLNLAPDHLDWHGSFEAYVEAKRRIYARQTTAGDVHVGTRDDVVAAGISSEAPCPVVWFRSDRPGPGEVGYRDGSLVSMLNGPEELGRDRCRAGGVPGRCRGRRRGLARLRRGGHGGARRVGERSLRSVTAETRSPKPTTCDSSTTPRRPTFMPRSPRSTASTTPC